MNVQLERLFRLFLVFACAAVPYSAHAADPNAYLYIAHAASGRNISSTTNPEYPVDFPIGGHCIAQGSTFGEIRGPFTLPAGELILIKASVSNVANSLQCGLCFFGGSRTCCRKHIDGSHSASTTPTRLSGKVFSVDLSAVPVGQGRLIVANTTSNNLTGSYYSR